MINNKKNKTFFLNKEEKTLKGDWFVLDANGKTLGRFASEVAKILRGKHRTTFTPHVSSYDGVIVINSEKICVTGNKENKKIYQYYTGHVGGRREILFSVMKDKDPTYIIYHAVKGMMPKTKLGRHQLKKLRVFVGSSHFLSAQVPSVVNI